MNTNSYAVIVGISDYPYLSRLKGPGNDAKAMHGWLTDPTGGGVPPNNAHLIVSGGSSSADGPTKADVDRAFGLVLDELRKSNEVCHRIYIYLSGHGFASGDDAALLMADASQETLGNSIGAKAYADALRNSGLFEEVVMFADCDRRVPASAMTSPPPWTLRRQPSTPDTAFFYVYATGFGETAWEESDAPDGVVHGSFTRALLRGLRGEARGADGTITSDTLSHYLESQPGSHTDQKPFVLSGGRPIIFGAPPLATGATPDNQTKTQSSQSERMPTLDDDPARVDELGRRPFAEVLAARIEEVRTQGQSPARVDGPAFMVHIHGPWGSGKTSILNFLRAHLQDNMRPRKDRWVVVDFNAWRQQRIRPPWWALISSMYGQAVGQVSGPRKLILWLRWLLWRARADWVPTVVASSLVVTAVLIGAGIIRLMPPTASHAPSAVSATGTRSGRPTAGSKPANAAPTQVSPTQGLPSANPVAPVQPAPASSDTTSTLVTAIETALKAIVTLSAAAAAVFTFSRSLVFGSARAAQAYADLRTDPLQPIIRMCQKLVKAVNRPVIVFVDDLDRCDYAYVVELLEGIQTLFRTVPVTYVVAADRKWICSSFEKTFETFENAVSEVGRPLGYLFLDKLFQISASVPRLSFELQQRYWAGLLRPGSAVAGEAREKAQKEAEAKASETVKDIRRQEDLQKKIDEVRGQPLDEQAMRAAAAKQITSASAQRETEHRLKPFAPLLEPNPRAMKRLVNAVGLNQATYFLEGREVDPEVLALWTIIELRWPLLAEFLAAHPGRVAEFSAGNLAIDKSIPKAVRSLSADGAVNAVIKGQGGIGLDESRIRAIVGLPRST